MNLADIVIRLDSKILIIVRLIIIIIVLFSNNFFSQFGSPFKFDCDNFRQEIKTNSKEFSVEFLSKEIYDYYSKDSIQKNEIVISENLNLNSAFQKKFPGTITENCVNAKFLNNDFIQKIKGCNSNMKINLLDKKDSFYIFRVSGFEISGYYAFDERNKVIITTQNFPQIINDELIIDVGKRFSYKKSISYYKIKGGKIDYINIVYPALYEYKDLKIIKSLSGKIQAFVELINFDFIEVPSNNGGEKYERNPNKYCIKRISIY